jgi:hypothetical protein
MGRTLNLGIGAGAVAAAVTMVAGVASATSGAPRQAASHAAAVVLANKQITRAQAVRIAEAKVPNSRASEVESDDLNDHPVWKVTLRTPHGRVIVDVDKRTGKATIVRRDGGHGDAAGAFSLTAGRSARGSAAASVSASGSGRDVRGDDGARHELGDRQDRDHGDRQRHDDGQDHRDGDHGDGDQ